MPFDLSDLQFTGPALPEPFVKFELENELTKLKLLAKTTGNEGKQLKADWDVYRRELAKLAVRGGYLHVRNQVIKPLCKHLGYDGEEIESAADVETREGREDGGYLLVAPDGAKLRVWTTDFDEDLDAPAKRGQAYRFSHLRIAQRVLLATGERVGLLTNGVELRLLISDPARPDSQVIFTLDPNWKRSREVPDSFRLLLALATTAGVQKIPELVDKARLQQARVTKDLRDQARQAIGRFIQEVLDHPDNKVILSQWQRANGSPRPLGEGQGVRAVGEAVDDLDSPHPNPLPAGEGTAGLARALWHEGLIIVYRLLFVLKLESSDDPARSFTFASTSLWRNTFSPSMALARYAPMILHDGVETGGMLEQGLRGLFRMFHEGVECTELNVKPLGGAMFSADATPVLSQLRWGERAIAHLLDQLLWTTPKRKGGARERVHYGPLDVEDLGRVYEALLELEPGIAAEPMCRLRRQKLEVVVPVAQGEKYRPTSPLPPGEGQGEGDDADDTDDAEEPEDDEDDSPKRGKKTTVQWIEEIRPGKFYLRVGLGRKATGSYYTPHSFVRFLVQETLGPQVAERSPQDDPQPGEILKLKVCDPAMGSGHFLVEACRFLGQHLYEAARLCDEKATAAERRAEQAKRKEDREAALAEAQKYRQRVIDLPDPDDELLRYLPSRSVEGDQSGVSQRRAEALCRRLVAVHCLYGVDKNPLAVELAKLALWLESHAEGMPLTFLDHRLVVGDSLTGPFWEQMLSWPSKPKEKFKEGLYGHIETHLRSALFDALRHVKRLEATVGVSLAEVNDKAQAKSELDEALLPFRVAAAAWSGGAMLGSKGCDDAAYMALLEYVGTHHELPDKIESDPLRQMIARGLGINPPLPPGEGRGEGGWSASDLQNLVASGRCVPALTYDLTFPEVFYPSGVPFGRQGFDAVVGNPPWDVVEVQLAELMAAFDPDFEGGRAGALEESLQRVAGNVEAQLIITHATQRRDEFTRVMKAMLDDAHGGMDLYACFAARFFDVSGTMVGIVVPDAFHRNKEVSWLRKRLWSGQRLQQLAGFVNEKKLFGDLPGVVQFDLAVIDLRGTERPAFTAVFKQNQDKVLFDRATWSDYPWAFARSASPVHLTLLEVRSTSDAQVCNSLYADNPRLDSLFESWHIDLGQEVNKRAFGHYFAQLPRITELSGADPRTNDGFQVTYRSGLIPLLEGKSIQIHDILWAGEPHSHWNPIPTLALNLADSRQVVRDKVLQLRSRLRFFRLMARQTCGSPLTNERSAVFALAFPGISAIHSIIAESQPYSRPNMCALVLEGLLNTFTFDFAVRLQIGPNLSKFILETIPVPASCQTIRLFVAHHSLRLAALHERYCPLWQEQLGDVWREPGKPPMTWPVLAGDDERWAVRAAIDAVVADAYGLSRDQYAHVLSTFSHASYRKAPELCLARFDELKAIGLEAFTRKHDPYWDIPLNDNLPQPVIDLPVPTEAAAEQTSDGLWKERSGQISFLSPGPLFDRKSDPPQKRGRKKK